ncbi:SGNH/GDSL hydrolase family protein [Muriicola soli]|uniref:SGNH/GDSL hydrolase family protein n=1 Tax=Muriicola soli TaxID=2507538 RepID=A0A411ED89_9FLAO|nr:SGNH/GDSL hydrolase family protein [Muriicola soli]
MRSIVFLLVVFITYVGLYGQDAATTNSPSEPVKVLFVGNSLVYTNNLPDLVQKEALSKGIDMDCEMIAFPNYAIIDHWKDGMVQKLISEKAYDFVILQQGPSSQKEGRRMLIEDGKKYRELCEKYNAQLCYFMVWPSLAYFETFDGVIQNYRDAASINNAIILPVGEVWKDYIEQTKKFDYYGRDQFHPSTLGSTVAAKVIVKHLIPPK